MEHVLSAKKRPELPYQSDYNDFINPKKYHSYVNVDLSTSLTSHQIRELHRTTKSRQEFLSSQPGGFVL